MVMIRAHLCACGGAGQVQQLAGAPCILAGDDIGAGETLQNGMVAEVIEQAQIEQAGAAAMSG